MNTPTDDGGPAFPCDFNMSTFEHEVKGMLLRDYFAGQALAGIMAVNGPISPAHDSKICYEMADAMLEARKINTTSK